MSASEKYLTMKISSKNPFSLLATELPSALAQGVDALHACIYTCISARCEPIIHGLNVLYVTLESFC